MADLLTAGNVEVETTDDVFLTDFAGGRLQILQPASGYRAGLDAVVLAAALRIGTDRIGNNRIGHNRLGSHRLARVLDAGSGVGVVGLCVARRLPDTQVTLVEKAPQLAALAQRNIARNDLAGRVVVVEADVCARQRSATATLKAESFDHVLANPPYLEEGRGRASADSLKAGSHAMAAGRLDEWLRFLARMAAPGGSLTIIHRADALPIVLDAVARRFGAIEVVPIHPRSGAPAHRILVRGRKGSRAPLTIRPGVIVHGDDNRYMPQLEAVLRHGAGLFA